MSDTPRIDLQETDQRARVEDGITKAVALGYERGVDDAPIVLANGRGAIAEQILAIAFERGIKVRKDSELVEILSLVDVDSPIPLEAFSAVAEIRAYVYQANAALKNRPRP